MEEEPEKIKKLNKIIADLKSVTKEHHNEKPYQLKVPVLNITEIRLLLNNFSSNCSQSQFIGMYFRNFFIKLWMLLLIKWISGLWLNIIRYRN